METVRVARQAMGSRFEVVLRGDDPVRLRASAEEALDEINALDEQLSTYKETSELSLINARAADGPVQVEPTLFALLQRIEKIHRGTHGAFDPTVGPLMATWGFVFGTGELPDSDKLQHARSITGMDKVELDPARRTIRFRKKGMTFDLGGVGKGYALEEATRVLRDVGIEHGLIHGGTSTVCAIGDDGEGKPWNIAIPYPETGIDLTKETDKVLSVVGLKDEALSVSAIRGKAFEANGRVYGHVLDPRAGEPVQGAHLAAVVHPHGTEADALSTAMLVLGEDGPALIRSGWPEARFLAVLDERNKQGVRILHHGLPLEPAE